jgi:hypothetical protein
MGGLTVKELLALKGVRQIAFVQISREEEAIAASQAGMDMIGTGYRDSTRHIASLVLDSHFQYGLQWGRHARVYRNFAAERDRLRQERIDAYREYIAASHQRLILPLNTMYLLPMISCPAFWNKSNRAGSFRSASGAVHLLLLFAMQLTSGHAARHRLTG